MADGIPIAAMKVTEAEDRLSTDKNWTLVPPCREQWDQKTTPFPADSLICYTDGSRLEDRGTAGAGIYVGNKGIRESYALGRFTTVFQAEVFAIMKAASNEKVRNASEQIIYICSDSQAALRAAIATRTRCALVQECTDTLRTLARTKDVRLMWVPSHSGIAGNEKADRLAKYGAQKDCIGPEPQIGITRQQVKTALYAWADDQLEREWRNRTDCRQTKVFVPRPDKAKSQWLLHRSRQALNSLVGILTGHCKLRRHLSLIGVEENPTCQSCGEDEETSYHFLGECVALGRLRQQVFGTPTLRREEAGSLDWSDILTFVRMSGRFDQGAEI